MIPLGEDDGLHRSWWRMLLGLLDDEATRRCRLSGHADAVFAELGPRWHMCEPSGGGPPRFARVLSFVNWPMGLGGMISDVFEAWCRRGKTGGAFPSQMCVVESLRE